MVVALLPASPRKRRRLIWLAASGIVAALIAVAILSLPSPRPAPETFSGKASVDTPGQTHVPRLERQRINTTIDRFVLVALKRGDLGKAWDLAGPDLRGTSTRVDWIAGRTPVLPFPAAGTHFPGWTHVVARPSSVTFDLLIQPRAGSSVGATAFSVQVIRRNGAWAVNRWYTAATFTPVGTKRPHIVGPNDFGAVGRGSANPNAGANTTDAPVARWWLAVPASFFVVGLLVIGIVVGRNWLRYRRMRAAVRAERAGDQRGI